MFDATKIENVNQLHGGISTTPAFWQVRYNGGITDWTTGVADNAILDAVSEKGININDAVLLYSSSEQKTAIGVISPVGQSATKIGLAIVTLTDPT